MAISPTQRSLNYLRDEGYMVEVVEHRHHFTRKLSDLFGFIDILALRPGETLGVQTTTGAHVSTRMKKIRASDKLPMVLEAGWKIHVHGWRQNAAGKWVLRTEPIE